MDSTTSDFIATLLDGEDSLTTLEISKAMFGEGATKKVINKHLYKMLSDGIVVKTCEENGTKPRWSLKQK